MNYVSFTTTILGSVFGFSRRIRVTDRQEENNVRVTCARKCSRTRSCYTRLFIPPLAMTLGSALAACSERLTRAISAEDRALTETAGFLSIIILAIVGLFGPTVYKWWLQR